MYIYDLYQYLYYCDCLRYVAPRWDAFSKALLSAAKTGIAFDKTKFKTSVFDTVEKPFADDLDTFYPSSPIGEYPFLMWLCLGNIF